MIPVYTDEISLHHLRNDVRTLCSRGWAVFPLLPGKKTPATPSGFKDAVSDPNRVISLFNRPDYNIGIATGLSNLVVLDVDGDEGRVSLLNLLNGHQLPNTFTVTTRRGKHFYFRQPEGFRIGCSAGKIGLNLDIRGDGGYVVGPTSWVEADSKGPAARYNIIDDSPVAPIPGWLLNAINARSDASSLERARTPETPIHRLPDTPRQRTIFNVQLSLTSADCDYQTWRNVVWGILSTGWPDAQQIARQWSETAAHRFDEESFNRLVNSYEDHRYTGNIVDLLKRKMRGGL